MAPINKLDIPTGVITGDSVCKLFEYAKQEQFAIPSVNVTSSSTANAVLEAARDVKSPIILQVSQGGSAYFAGKGLANDKQQASITGAVAAALHIRTVAKSYGIPVIIHTDHCAKKLLPWFDGMLEADKKYFREHQEPLFSSHMLDLSEEPNEQNIETCRKYFTEMAVMKQWLEMEIGITGGEEDGVDNTGVDKNKLYTEPREVFEVYDTLSKISPNFSVAAAFGNVHGVYKPGNVQLKPSLLRDHQNHAISQLKEILKKKHEEKSEKKPENRLEELLQELLVGTKDIKEKEKLEAKLDENIKENFGSDKPIFLVFHGGSGSSDDEIKEAVRHGVVKMNIDTDTQFAYLVGIRDYVEKNKPYLQSQVGNPDGPDKPNKKYYDPRTWVRKGEETLAERVKVACIALNSAGKI